MTIDSSRCNCAEHLTLYYVLYVDNPAAYVNHDWIQSTGTMMLFEDEVGRTLMHHSGFLRSVWAFTIGEVQKLIRYEQGNKREQPLHRILNEDAETIQECQVLSQEDIAKMARERTLKRLGYDQSGGNTADS